MTDLELLESIKANSDLWIKYFYSQWRPGFISWLAKQLGIDQDNSAEIFQATMVSFYENAKAGKVTHLTSSLKTYFFAIGKNKGFTYLKARKKRSDLHIDQYILYNDLMNDNDPDNYESRLKFVSELLNSLGEPCYPLLQLFYFQKLNWEKIANTLGYKNVNSAKNMKYKCLLKIRKLALENRFNFAS